jgi:hypothetical protein
MKGVEKTLRVLNDELQFLRRGGYRPPLAWRAPLVFEDSPRCPRRRCIACQDTDCVLMSFVPKECRYEAVPCRHIPLNYLGETLDSLYRTGTNEELERTLESWLLERIRQLEETCEWPWLQKAA